MAEFKLKLLNKKWNLNARFLWQYCCDKSATNKPIFQSWPIPLCIPKSPNRWNKTNIKVNKGDKLKDFDQILLS